MHVRPPLSMSSSVSCTTMSLMCSTSSGCKKWLNSALVSLPSLFSSARSHLLLSRSSIFLYDCWVINSGNFLPAHLCLVLTNVPETLGRTNSLNWVAFDKLSFKAQGVPKKVVYVPGAHRALHRRCPRPFDRRGIRRRTCGISPTKYRYRRIPPPAQGGPTGLVKMPKTS